MVDIANVASAIHSKIDTISFLNNWYQLYPENSKFYYDYYTVYDNVMTIDVKSFNLKFLGYINRFMKEPIVDEFIKYSEQLNKDKRVVQFGLLFREISKYGISLNHYMIATRNIILINFVRLHQSSYRNISLHRINYDDIEFSMLNQIDADTGTFVHEKFIDTVKVNTIDHVVVLSKKDGVFYLSKDKISDIKYTSGWVNIPIYRTLLNEVLQFIVKPTMSMKELHVKLNEIVEFTDNDHFFGYEDCPISKKYRPDDNVPYSIKNLFIANVMSKFVMLFNRM